jgi:hypothetical protein
MIRVGVIERAFQLAGDSGSLEELRRKLRNEGYALVDAHLSGSQIKRQLKVRLANRAQRVSESPTCGDLEFTPFSSNKA